jgi:LPXTG-site transpeptidase (sortase) family protein
MVRTWPSLGRRAHLPAGLLGEVALGAALVAALLFSSTDGKFITDVVDPVAAPSAAYIASAGGFAGPAHGRSPLALPSPLPEPPIPNAHPATILIPSLNVHRPVEAVGVDSAGTLYNVGNAWDAGWYKEGPVPGAPGDAVIEGHAGYPKAPLLFGKLGQLRRGDRIIIVLADGSRQLFLVQSLAIWPAGTSPPGLGSPYGKPRLTLITCTGPFDDHYKTYADRLAVEASYAGPA